MRLLSYLVSGVLFGLGLVLGGMTQPSKVTGFLDFFGDWDPSLAFVMGGAILVHLFGYRLMKRKSHPVWGLVFQVPTRRDLDLRLILGSAIFGAGWGMAGYCPGPALTSLSTMRVDAFVFIGAMAGGMLLFDLVDKRARAGQPEIAPTPEGPKAQTPEKAHQIAKPREAT